MARLLRGRNAGTDVVLHQASNDWVSADIDDEKGRRSIVLNPTSIGFTSDGDREVVEAAGGHFWALFEWTSEARVRLRRKAFA